MRSSSSRRIVVAVAVVGAVAFALAVYGGRWWVWDQNGSTGEIGPFGVKRCFGDDCAAAGFTWIGGVTERWLRIATATWASALVSMLGLVMLAGAVAAGRTPKLVAKSTLVACACAVAAGGAFIAKFPGLPGVSLGRGTLIYAAAILCGAFAATKVLLTTAPAPAAAA